MNSALGGYARKEYLLVKIYERVGKTVISVRKKGKKGY